MLKTINCSFLTVLSVCSISWLDVLGFNATWTAKVISVTHVFPWLSHISTNTTFFLKATDYFSHMPLQMWEAKICQKESLPQPSINLTTTQSWICTLTTEPPRRGPGNSISLTIFIFMSTSTLNLYKCLFFCYNFLIRESVKRIVNMILLLWGPKKYL